MYVPLIDLFKPFKNELSSGMIRVIIDGKGTVPTRIKFGLNISKSVNGVSLPSNICFNAKVPNEKIVKKTGTFKWCTMFDGLNQKFICITLVLLKMVLVKQK